MRHRFIVLAALIAAPALAAPGGKIDVLKPGSYVCELPGDALGLRGRHMPDEDFLIVNASNYDVGGLRGSYLLIGGRVTMTSGPRRGVSYRRISGGTLRLLQQDGSETTLNCVRGVANNS